MATVQISELRTASKYSINFFNDTEIWEIPERQYIDIQLTDESADLYYARIKNAIERANKQDSKKLKHLCNVIVLNRGFEFEQTHQTIK